MSENRDNSLLDIANFKTRVRERLSNLKALENEPAAGDHNLNPSFQDTVLEKAVKPAAILIPVVARESGLQMVFTKRTEKLKSHSGQISFPGGRIDAGDCDAKQAALRETNEEIGIATKDIEVLGQLPDYFAGSGYQIACIVGIINPKVDYRRNPDEVDYIFEAPVEFMMNPKNHKIGSRVFEKIERHYYEMPWQEHYIWGVTAGIVRMFYNRVFK